MIINCMCLLFCFFLFLCGDISDFKISPTPIPQLDIYPVQISIQLLNDQYAGEMDMETLQLKLTELQNAGRPNEFVLSDVEIKIRNIKCT